MLFPGVDARRGIRGWSAVPILLLTLAAPTAPAQQLPPEMLLLGRVRRHLEQTLNQLPDYTCQEVIRRFIKPPGSQEPPKPFDAIRLEVLYSERHEMYALPGERRFGERDISAFISGGMIGNGNFALYVESVFLNLGAVLTYAGEEDVAGRRAARYDFSLSRIVSGLNLAVEYRTGMAGMKGSAWVAPETLDVVRLVWHAEDISPELPVQEATMALNYAPVRIGSEDVMLPKDGEFYLRTTSGREDRNLFEFKDCREYRAESSISFGAEPESVKPAAAAPGAPQTLAAPSSAGAKPAAPAGPQPLPAEVQVVIALADAITEKDTVGAAIKGEVVSDVMRNGVVLIPKGAVISGRIRRLETAPLGKRTYFAVGLEFTELESGGVQVPFHADLVKLDRVRGLERALTVTKNEIGARSAGAEALATIGKELYTIRTEKIMIPETPGVASFFMRGDSFQLPKGFKTVWKTRADAK